ncbi:response regulator [Catellatospora coxensis]
MIGVLLVDDHPIVRAGLRATLEADPGLRVLGEAAGGDEAVRLARELRPDVVLMDLQLGPGIDGAAATARVRELPEPPRVLILTTYDSDADILRAIEAGAIGYLLKDAEPADLLRRCARRPRGDGAGPVRGDAAGVARARPGISLTPRETQVLQLVAGGHSNSAIARRLFISEATVKSHLVQVFAKLGVDNRTAATAEGRRRGFIR